MVCNPPPWANCAVFMHLPHPNIWGSRKTQDDAGFIPGHAAAREGTGSTAPTSVAPRVLHVMGGWVLLSKQVFVGYAA